MWDTWITRPTINSMRDMLTRLENSGWSPDQLIQIGQIANAPDSFVVTPVEKWLGSFDALPDHYKKES